jgi:AAA domain
MLVSNPDPSSDAAQIDELFCRPQAPFGTFRRDEPPVVVVEGLVVRARLERDDDRYELTLYRDIDGFPGELWERSAKTMLRLRALNHPALPRIVTANYLRGPRVAFTLTEERGRPLDPAEAVRWAAVAPLEAFEQFSLLLDALKRLHGSRTMHRLMLPTAFRVIESADSLEARLSLSRFEMSALISNVIRRVVGNDAVEVRSIVRQLYLTPAPGPDPDGLVLARHLAYLAPEIHPYLFDDHHRSRRDWDTTDIFGLGVFGWEMFCGGLPQRVPQELAAVAASEGSGRIRALADLHGAMRDLLRREPEVPQALRAVLAEMLATEPAARSSSFTVATRVEREWDAIRSHWEAPVDKPYLVAFMAEESANSLYNERHWIPRNPVDAAGREALRAFYEDELEQAYLVHSLTGAEGYASGPSDLLQEAEWVLIGQRAVWFCAYLRERALGGTIREVHEDTLVIKYLREHDYARELYTAQPRRRIPAIDLVALRPGQPLGSIRNGRPSWAPLVKSIRRDPLRDHLNEEFLQSLDFLLNYQRAELEARTYPYVAEDDGGQIVVLRYDEERDDAWRQRTPLFSAYARDQQRRPALGDFVSGLDSGDGWTQLTLDGRLDRPRFTGQSSVVQFVARRDDHSVEVRVPFGARVPARGWLRPAADSGSRTHLDRQLRARQALETQSALVTELRSPRPMGIGRQQWQLDPARRLYGNAPAVIRDMLSRFPLYALQGPPGSGKTTAVANALKLYLAVERGAKVLVSAQSNYALDNLAERLIKALPDGLIVLREVTARATDDKVSSAVKPYILTELTDRTRREVERRLDERLKPAKTAAGEAPAGERQLTDAERQISIEWRAKVQADQIELSDRLRSGASVVLATCSVAATALDDAAQLTDAFDWVILEEAAKAWPTELIIPLTMGTRWTLVGDHRQLGAYRSDDVERFLESLEGYPNERVRLHYDAREKRLDVLNLFRTLFEQKDGDEGVPGDGKHQPAWARGNSEGLGRLTMQFRMHRDIAEPVRRAFYPAEPKQYDENSLPVSFLESHESATEDHGVVTPRYLKRRPLVWVDTGDYPRCQDELMWSNDGEVALIEKIVSRMHPPPAPPGEDEQDSLAILTPYLAQVTKLQSRDLLRNRVHTVHSFQGREADRVIVSLVRTTRVSDHPQQNVGHVGKDEVVNVLLSRAKRLLLLVGRFSHFRDNGGPTWQLVTGIVERYGCVVPASEWADQ